jgi:hypothetical protein
MAHVTGDIILRIRDVMAIPVSSMAERFSSKCMVCCQRTIYFKNNPLLMTWHPSNEAVGNKLLKSEDDDDEAKQVSIFTCRFGTFYSKWLSSWKKILVDE